MTIPIETMIGDHTFQEMTDPYRHELMVHAYRILGSLEDAEDAVQETLLRAWRRLDTLKVQASLRAWLYKITTHVCLDMLDHRKARLLPTVDYASAEPDELLPAAIQEPIWLEPLPEGFLSELPNNPEARYEVRESVTLAFLTVLQVLPGRQRVILILRDVLGWKAQEVADLLNLTVVAVNSALQRARATLKSRAYEPQSQSLAPDSRTLTLLQRYLEAWEAADSHRLIAVLREDAILTMPPFPVWYQGHGAIQGFLERHLFTASAAGRFRLVATRANHAPAFALYERDANDVYRPGGLHVLTLARGQIARIDDFLVNDNRLFSQFGLPLTR